MLLEHGNASAKSSDDVRRHASTMFHNSDPSLCSCMALNSFSAESGMTLRLVTAELFTTICQSPRIGILGKKLLVLS
jgi:hypothetical protein